MFRSFITLITRSVFLVIVSLFFSKFLLLPIAEYFWPPSSIISPRTNLEAIVTHSNLLAHIEAELQEYVSPTGRATISHLLQHMDNIAKEHREDDDLVNNDSYNANLLAKLENFETTQFLKVYTLGERITALTNSTTLEILQVNFNALRKYGIILDSDLKNTEELVQGDGKIVSDVQTAEDCIFVLDLILNLIKDGDTLTEMITKVASEIEIKLNQDETLEDLNVAAQVEHFNAESDRLKNEMDTLVRQHRDALSRTYECILNVASRVQDLFDEFQGHQKVYNRDYVKRFDKLVMKLESLSGTTKLHSSSLPMTEVKSPNIEL